MAVKKVILCSCFIMLILIQSMGCRSAKQTNKDPGKTLVETAYESLSENERETIVDWKNAKVEEDSNSAGCLVAGPNGIVNTKGKNVYLITFRTDNEAALGPISVFIDKNTGDIIGVGLRD